MESNEDRVFKEQFMALAIGIKKMEKLFLEDVVARQALLAIVAHVVNRCAVVKPEDRAVVCLAGMEAMSELLGEKLRKKEGVNGGVEEGDQ